MIAPDHDIKECWNPQFHGPFKKASAAIFAAWYAKEYHGKVFHDMERFAALPLCVFGGKERSPYTCTEKSLGGTFAACPACETAFGCGWGEAGITPKCGCGAKLAPGDYFQAAMLGLKADDADRRKLIDPAKDPAVTVAELCALAPDGIPSAKIAPLIVILTAQGMLRTGKHLDYDRYESRSSGIESDQVREAVSSERWTCVHSATIDWRVTPTEYGKILLKARNIRPDRRASREIEIMLGYDGKRLKYEAISKLAAMLMP